MAEISDCVSHVVKMENDTGSNLTDVSECVINMEHGSGSNEASDRALSCNVFHSIKTEDSFITPDDVNSHTLQCKVDNGGSTLTGASAHAANCIKTEHNGGLNETSNYPFRCNTIHCIKTEDSFITPDDANSHTGDSGCLIPDKGNDHPVNCIKTEAGNGSNLADHRFQCIKIIPADASLHPSQYYHTKMEEHSLLYPIDDGLNSSTIYLKPASHDRLELQCYYPNRLGVSHGETGYPESQHIILDIKGDIPAGGTSNSLPLSSPLEACDNAITQCDVRNHLPLEGACPKHEQTVTGDKQYSPVVDLQTYDPTSDVRNCEDVHTLVTTDEGNDS
jgi:hypothetical protein